MLFMFPAFFDRDKKSTLALSPMFRAAVRVGVNT